MTNGAIQNQPFSFVIHNAGAQPLEFLSTNVESQFSRLQVTMSSVIVEGHASNYNRRCTLFTQYQSTDKILEQSSMTATGGQAPFAVGPHQFSVDQIKPTKIPAGEKRCVGMRLTMSFEFAGSDKWLQILALN